MEAHTIHLVKIHKLHGLKLKEYRINRQKRKAAGEKVPKVKRAKPIKTAYQKSKAETTKQKSKASKKGRKQEAMDIDSGSDDEFENDSSDSD